MSNAHAILAPSSAGRWLACPPSARFEEQIPEEETPYAAEGTIAHDVAALLLAVRAGIYKGGTAQLNRELNALDATAAAFYKSQGKPNAFNDMYDHAEDYADFVKGQFPLTGKYELLIERKLYMDKYAPLCFGRTDAAVMTPRVLFVDDYKYGSGVRVSAVGNKQEMLYGLGALLEAHKLGYDPDVVVMAIFQPRISETASTWEIDTADLLDWAEDELKPQATLAIAGQGEFKAGKHCHFCKAKTMCRAYYDKFDDVKTIKDKRIMTDKDLKTVLTFGSMVAAWVKKVEEEAKIKLQQGRRIPGFKLVAGRQHRAFIREDDVVDTLLGEGYDTEDIFKSELRPLTDLEGKLGKKRFATLFANNLQKVEGNPQLVDETDDRPAIDRTAADDYDDFEDLTL